MIFPLFRRSARPGTISALYGAIVAQARLPAFYRDYGVPDTVEGRFELIVLHLALLLERIGQEPGLRGVGQGVFDRFCQDMDDNLREIGIGDLAMPKHMRRVRAAFYGRAQAYREALARRGRGSGGSFDKKYLWRVAEPRKSPPCRLCPGSGPRS